MMPCLRTLFIRLWKLLHIGLETQDAYADALRRLTTADSASTHFS